MPLGQTRTILVVDDDAVSRHVLGQALTRAGYRHLAVDNGAAALRSVARERPALVLLDLMMPDPDGYQVLAALRADEATRELPVVVLTGVDADDEIARVFAAGADDFVRKPFRYEELIARVEGQLRLKKVQNELRERETDLEVVLEISQALASSLDIRTILSTVVQRIAEVAQVDRVSIVLVRGEEQLGYVVATSDDQNIQDLPLDLGKYPEIQRALQGGEPLVIDDADTHPLFELVRGEQRAAYRSLLLLPIVDDGKPLGVLFLRAQALRSFDARELDLCKTVCSAMAVALRNAQVFQRLRDQTQQGAAARVEAERTIRNLQQFADFFESSADGMVVIDTRGALMFSNRRAREMTGYEEADFRDRPLFGVLAEPPADVPALLDVLRSGQFCNGIDLAIVTKSAEPRILNANFSTVSGAEGFVLCTFRDVTEARALEHELVRTKEYLQRVIDSSFDAIVSIDNDGVVVLFNGAAERLLQRRARDVLGKPLRDLYPHDEIALIKGMLSAAADRVEDAKLDLLLPDGSRVPVSFSASRVFDGERKLGAVGIFSDLRERLRMEKELTVANEELVRKERQAAVAALAGAAAHELNQPLQSVLGYTQLLMRKLGDAPHTAEALQVIHVEVERMATIVRKIGTITRVETKAYVGGQEILDLDRASAERRSSAPPRRES